MARDIDLMVLPSRVAEDPPRFLVSTHGFWRDLGSATKLENLSTLQTKIDEQLRADMEALDPQVGGTIAFGNYFSLIYEPFVPGSLHQILKDAQPDNQGDPPPVLRLHIDPSLDWIPWEVAHDGDEYLGLRLQIARLPIVALGKEPPPPAEPRKVAQIYNFLGEFVLDAALMPSWQQTFAINGAAGVSETRFPTAANPPRFPRVGDVEAAAADASIVHFTCHGGLKDAGTEGGSFWTLNHKQPSNPQFKIHAPIVRALKNRLPKTQPLIFGNACGSSGEAAGLGGLVNSFGSLFVQSGASAFVGTFAPVAKARAIEFAQQFYKRLFDSGEPIGTALWRTKQLLRTQTPSDPSSLFYCHYGMPTTRYTLGN
jgi:hypothetical protein